VIAAWKSRKTTEPIVDLLRVGPRLLIGYDFFISYAHEDGSPFANRLEEELLARDFTVFRDDSELHGGESLSFAIKAAIYRTRRLVVVGTQIAVNRPWIQREIDLFQARGKSIVPLDIHNIRTQQQWFDPDDVLFIEEPKGDSGPSEDVVDRISRGMYRQRLARRARQVVSGVGVILVVLLVAAIVAAVSLVHQRDRARTEATIARVGQVSKLVEIGPRSVPVEFEGWNSFVEASEICRELGLNALPVALAAFFLQEGNRDFRQGGPGRRPGFVIPLTEARIDSVPRAVAWENDSALMIQTTDGRLWRWKLGKRPYALPYSGDAFGSNIGHITLSETGIEFLNSGGLQRLRLDGTIKTVVSGPVNAFSRKAVIVQGRLFVEDKEIDTGFSPVRVASIGTVWATAARTCKVVVHDDGPEHLWNRRAIDHGTPVLALDLHPLAVGVAGGDGRLRVTTVHGQEIALKGHLGPVTVVQFGTEHLLSAGNDGTARLWEWELSEEKFRMVGPRIQVNSAQLSPNGRLAVTAAKDGAIRIWPTGAGLRRKLVRSENLDHWLIASGVIIGWTDEELRIWSVKTAALTMQTHLPEQLTAAFMSGSILEVCGNSGQRYRLRRVEPQSWERLNEKCSGDHSLNQDAFSETFPDANPTEGWKLNQNGEDIIVRHPVAGEVVRMTSAYVGHIHTIPGILNLVHEEEHKGLTLWMLEDTTRWLKVTTNNTDLAVRLAAVGSCETDLARKGSVWNAACVK
jgi:hypothetical protein